MRGGREREGGVGGKEKIERKKRTKERKKDE